MTADDLDKALSAAITRLPEALYDGEPEAIDFDLEETPSTHACDRRCGSHGAREGATLR